MSSQFGSKQEPLPIAGVEVRSESTEWSATGDETVIKVKSRHEEGVDPGNGKGAKS